MAVPAQYSGSGNFAVLDYISDIAREGASSRLVRWQELRIPRCTRDDNRKFGNDNGKASGTGSGRGRGYSVQRAPEFRSPGRLEDLPDNPPVQHLSNASAHLQYEQM
jgi:hypothetical protein